MAKEKNGLQKIVFAKLTNEAITPKSSNNYSVLVMDKESSKVVSNFCKTSEIISQKIALIEDLDKKRKPFPDLDAIYLIKADRKSVNLIINDFNLSKPMTQFDIKEAEQQDDKKKNIFQKIICFRKVYEHYYNYVYEDVKKQQQKQEEEREKNKEPDITARYRSAYIYFIGRSDFNFEKIIQDSAAKTYVKDIKYIDINYFPIERQVFLMNLNEISIDFYREKSESKLQRLDALADQLVSLCLSLDEYPMIRYRNAHNLRDDFAVIFQKKLDLQKQKNPSLGQGGDKARSQLLILDRSFDPVSPLLHEFTYQAMAYDLIDISADNKYTYKSPSGMVSRELNENDEVWTELRHQHVAVTSKLLVENYEKFKKSKPQIEKSNLNLQELSAIIKRLPQYQKEIESYETHVSLTDECFKNYTDKRKKMSRYEQSVAMNSEPDGEPIKDSPKDIVELILDNDFDENDKLRLLMLIFLNKNGVSENSLGTYVSKLKDQERGTKVIQSLSKLGLEIIKDIDKPNKNIDRENKRERTHEFDESRWTPLVKDLMEDIIENKLNKKKYPYLKDNLNTPTTPVIGVSARGGGTNRRQEKGPTLIVFIIGGVSYSEMRSAYEVQRDALNRDNWQIYIGSNQIIRPIGFIDYLSKI